MTKYHLAICTLGKVRIEHEMTMLHQCFPMSMVRVCALYKNLSIIDARNLAIHEAMADEADYLFFWDDDMAPKNGLGLHHILTTMEQNPEIDLCGGVYPRRSDIPEPIVFKENGDSAWWGWQDEKTHQVYMTGTGFLCIRLASLAQVEEQVETYLFDKHEDGQPRRLRRWVDDTMSTDDFHLAKLAKELGLKWYVDGKVICEQIDLDGKVYRVEDARLEIVA